MTRALVAAALLAAAPALAQDRPSEEDLFGAPPSASEEPPAAPEQPKPPPAGPEEVATPPDDDRGARPGEPEPGAEDRLTKRLAETRETLAIGGQLYLRAFLFARKDTPPSQWELTAPSLLDVYLDARPTDRVRGFVLVRGFHDPTASEVQPILPLPSEFDDGQPLPVPGAQAREEFEVLLDQLWLRFDVGRRAFFTAGKQHVKWGVGRFWNPTDFLHRVRRNPLAPFDVRTGTTMVRLQVPWEARGWNLQAAAILEPLVPPIDETAPRAGQLGALGGALRSELVLGTAEVGVGGVVQKGRPARLGVDVSAGVWELDVYGELALRSAPELPLWREVPGATSSTPAFARFERFDPGGANPAATLGASWTGKYGDQDTLTIGAEYFYNRNGYADATIYPWLLLQGDFAPFYLGQHYAGAYVLLPGPGSWDTASFTLSALGNLSDGSVLGRLDYSLVVLTYLRFEAFLAAHAGTIGGEFRLGLDVPPQDLGGGVVTPRVQVGAPTFDAGVALRLAL
jgi:hypothetical protein